VGPNLYLMGLFCNGFPIVSFEKIEQSCGLMSLGSRFHLWTRQNQHRFLLLHAVYKSCACSIHRPSCFDKQFGRWIEQAHDLYTACNNRKRCWFCRVHKWNLDPRLI